MIIVSKEGDIINAKPASVYFKKVKDFIILWQQGVNFLEVKTSGSSGTPKTIRLSKAQILASVVQTTDAFGLNEDTIFLCNLGIDYIAGKLMIIRALELKAELIVIPPEGDILKHLGKEVYSLSRNQGRNFLAFVPLQLEKILKSSAGINLLNTAKAIIIGGAAMSEHLLRQTEQLFSPVYATYGMTETVTHIALSKIKPRTTFEKIRSKRDSLIYSPLTGIQIKIDTDSCLQIKGPTTENKWLNTNDIVKINKDNTFSLKGRKDNTLNSGGIKSNLDELEKKIDLKLKLEVPFFCYAKEDSRLGQRLILCLEQSEKDNGLLLKLKAEMPKFEAPKEIYFIPKFSRTGSGKIDKTKTINAYSVSNQ